MGDHDLVCRFRGLWKFEAVGEKAVVAVDEDALLWSPGKAHIPTIEVVVGCFTSRFVGLRVIAARLDIIGDASRFNKLESAVPC